MSSPRNLLVFWMIAHSAVPAKPLIILKDIAPRKRPHPRPLSSGRGENGFRPLRSIPSVERRVPSPGAGVGWSRGKDRMGVVPDGQSLARSNPPPVLPPFLHPPPRGEGPYAERVPPTNLLLRSASLFQRRQLPLLLRREPRLGQQIGPLFPGRPERHPLPPAHDRGVISGQQHLGHRFAFKDRRPAVVREIEQPGAEAVVFNRPRQLDHPGDLPRDRLDQHHRRQFPSRQDVVADRDLLVHHRLAHPLVDPLVTPAEQDQIAPPGQFAHLRLVQPPALRRKQHAPGGRPLGALRSLRQLPHRADPRRSRHHHPAAATVRLVVHASVPIFRVEAKVENLNVEQVVVPRPADQAGREKWREKLRKDRQDLDAHVSIRPSGSTRSIRPRSTSTSRKKLWTNGIGNHRSPSATINSSPPPSSITSTTLPRSRPASVQRQPISWKW